MDTARSEDYVPKRDYQKLAQKYNALKTRYQSLKEAHAECRAYKKRAYEKYKSAKDSINQWQAWLNSPLRLSMSKKFEFVSLLQLRIILILHDMA